jgi:hypothetical protein
MVLDRGQGHLVTLLSGTTTMSDDTEAYLHAYSIDMYLDLALVVD